MRVGRRGEWVGAGMGCLDVSGEEEVLVVFVSSGVLLL